jgi:uncharacterized protein
MSPQWQIRSAADLRAEGRTITIRPVVFDALSEDLGGFRERILPEAVDRTLREHRSVLAFVDHTEDPLRIIGRTTAQTLRLRKEERALRGQCGCPADVDGR